MVQRRTTIQHTPSATEHYLASGMTGTHSTLRTVHRRSQLRPHRRPSRSCTLAYLSWCRRQGDLETSKRHIADTCTFFHVPSVFRRAAHEVLNHRCFDKACRDRIRGCIDYDHPLPSVFPFRTVSKLCVVESAMSIVCIANFVCHRRSSF